GSSRSSMAWDRASKNRASARFRALPTRPPTRTSSSRSDRRATDRYDSIACPRAIIAGMSMLERAEAAERALSEELDRTVVKSVIYVSGDRDPRVPLTRPDNGKLVMMGQDPRLPRMPERPTPFDVFKYRFAPANHPMQLARLAQKNGVAEKLVLACLLHDIGIAGFIRGDHGYWAARS